MTAFFRQVALLLADTHVPCADDLLLVLLLLQMRMRAGQAGQQGVASPMAPPGQQFMMQKQ